MTANIQIPHKLIYKLNIMFALGFGDVRDRRTLSLLEITADCPHGKSSNCTRGGQEGKEKTPRKCESIRTCQQQDHPSQGGQTTPSEAAHGQLHVRLGFDDV